MQDNWVGSLLLADFTDTNSIHYWSLISPLWVNYYNHPMMQFRTPNDPSFRSILQADLWMACIQETHWIFQEIRIDPLEWQIKSTGRKGSTFAVADKEWRITKNCRTSRLSEEIEYKHTEPYAVSTIINMNAYTLDLASTMQNRNVFRISFFIWYTWVLRGKWYSEWHPPRVNESVKREVNHILDGRQHYPKRHFLAQRADYNHIWMSWELPKHHQNAQDLVEKVHTEHSHQGRQ